MSFFPRGKKRTNPDKLSSDHHTHILWHTCTEAHVCTWTIRQSINLILVRKKVLSMVAYALIPTLGRQKQAALYEFQANHVYRAKPRTARATQRESQYGKQTRKKKAMCD